MIYISLPILHVTVTGAHDLRKVQNVELEPDLE